jgi:hypothetical protein
VRTDGALADARRLAVPNWLLSVLLVVNFCDRLSVSIAMQNSQVLLYLTSEQLQRGHRLPAYALRHG